MFLVIDNILNTEQLDFLNSKLTKANFVDGKATAGWAAKLVKNNSQLDREENCTEELVQLVRDTLDRNALFKAAVQPKYIHTVIFSRYEPGMYYGSHVDNCLMGGNDFFRADVSFTIFLSDSITYTGGELVIEDACDDRKYKLQAGSAIIYPSSTLHRVEPVQEGTRLAIVGWVQSLVRNPMEREILFDLDTVRRSIFAQHGKSTEFDILSKSYSNLLRMWID